MTAHQAHQPPPLAEAQRRSRSEDDTPAEVSADVIVVGAGGGGLPTALFSRWLGDEVILLEKADQVGGTARKAAFWYWIPGNGAVARPGSTTHGRISCATSAGCPGPPTATSRARPWAWTPGRTSNSRRSTTAPRSLPRPCASTEPCPYRHVAQACDYWAELPENAAPRGRVLIHEQAAPSMADGGLRSVESMTRTALADGISLRTGHRVQRLVVDGPRVGGRRRGHRSRRTHGAVPGPQGGDLRHRQLRPRRRAAQELPLVAAVSRMRRPRHRRGRFRTHRRLGRGPAAEHELPGCARSRWRAPSPAIPP